MKKIIVSVLTLILTLSVGLFVACTPQSTSSNLTLNKTSVTVEKYMNAFIIAENGEGELKWSTSDESIVTVDAGKIYGVKEGSAVVTVTDGKTSKDCSVTVIAPNPEKFTVSVEGGDFSMYVGRTATLSPVLTYDNVPVEGGNFKFSTESSNITVSEDGVVDALKVGKAELIVTGSIDGIELVSTIIVDVLNTYSIVINQSNVVLYPFESYAGVSYNKTITCTASVLEEGKPVEVDASRIKWSVDNNQDVIEVDKNGKVTALNGGSAVLTVSCRIGGERVYGETTITVAPVKLMVEDVVLDAGLTTPFKPDLYELVGEEDAISKIIVNSSGNDEVEILPENGEFDLSELSSGKAAIYIVTRNYAYAFDAMIYDGVISNVEEMKALLSAETGFYKFIADIDMAEYVSDGEATDPNLWVSTKYFKGTIDGGNHVIKNFKTSTGLFARLNAGTVKDVAFTDVQLIGSTGVIAGGYDRSSCGTITIDNIFVSIKSVGGGGWYAGVVGQANLGAAFTLSNSVVVSSFAQTGIVGRVGSYAVTVKDCYLIGTEVYKHSMNTNQTPEQQQAAHNPATNSYVSFANITDAYVSYVKEEFNTSDFVGGVVEDIMAEQAEKVLLLRNENVADLLTFTGNTVFLVEDIDMATAYTANGGVWTSSLKFNGTFDGQGYTIKNFKTNTGLFNWFNGRFKNVSILDVTATGNCGVIAKGYARTGVSNVWVNDIHVSIAATSGSCDWYVGLYGSVNPGSPIYLEDVYFTSNVPGRAFVYGEYGSVAIEMQDCILVGLAKEYARSLNTNLTAEQQQALHLPDRLVYSKYANMHEVYYAYLNDELKVEGFVAKAIEADMAKLEGHTFSVKANDTVHWYECSCGVKLAEEEHYGEANCQNTAPCELCETVYGGNCLYNILKSDATHHWYECECGAADTKVEHFGGTPTCTEKAKCEICQTPYGELHNVTVLKYDDTYHWYQCTGCTVTSEKVGHFGGIATTTEKAKCEVCKQPYGELKPDYIEIRSSNIKDLLTALDGKYYIMEDIDMSTAYTDNGGVWASTMVFTGTLDGQGHTISNLNTSTGLFQQLGTTANGEVNVKNLAITGVQVTGQVGAISKTVAARGGLTINIDNVYVEHSTEPAWGGGGFFGRSPRLASEGTKLNISNSLVYINGSSGASYGLLSHTLNDAYGLKITNSYFVGAGGTLVVSANLAITTEGYKTYATKDIFAEDYLAGNVSVSEMIAKKVTPLLNVTTIDSSNVSTLLTATSGTYLITEDIDMATAYTANNGVWASSASFTGTIFGGGHTIKNFNTSTGLFGTANGGGSITVKNLAFTDVVTSGSIGILGGYSRTAANRVAVENVYLHVKSNTGGWFVGILGQANLADNNAFKATNCVVVSDISYGGVIGRVGSYAINMTNCYLVNTKGYVASLNTGDTATLDGLHLPTTNTATSYANLDALKTAYTAGSVNGLAGFIEDIIKG